jgi:hypothetical protein
MDLVTQHGVTTCCIDHSRERIVPVAAGEVAGAGLEPATPALRGMVGPPTPRYMLVAQHAVRHEIRTRPTVYSARFSASHGRFVDP